MGARSAGTNRRQRALQSDPWATGPWCWLLENFRAVVPPIPYAGEQGLFDVPASVLDPKKKKARRKKAT